MWLALIGLVPSATVAISGYVHADAVAWSEASTDELDPSSGEPLNQTRILLRRARLRANAGIGPFSAIVEIDGNTVREQRLRVVVAEVAVSGELDPVAARAGAGLFKIPFGHETALSSADRDFLEPPAFVRALFPGEYDLGARLRLTAWFLWAEVAVMNGHPIGERELPGRDPDAGKELVWRAGISAEPWDGLRMDAGTSGVVGRGFHSGTPQSKDVIVWRDANDNGLIEPSELQAIAGAPAGPSSTFDRFALGGDLRVRAAIPVLGDLFIGGEIVYANNLDRGLYLADPVAIGRDSRELGLSAFAVQELPLGFALGFRFDRYDPDADATEELGIRRVPVDASIETFAFMASWRWRKVGRLMVEYDHQNDALGRGENGAPARLGNDAFTIRAEVRF